MNEANEILHRWIQRKMIGNVSKDMYESAFKSDEEKMEIALKYLSTYEKPIDMQKQTKSTCRALAYIADGNKKFESSPWQDLLDIYTKAAMHAKINSNELARAYGNRSAALYTGGLYEDALIDIERALKIGYNDNTKTKLYVRRAKCLYAILKKKENPQIEEALADARKWLDKMKDTDKKYMTEILDDFPKNVSIKAQFKKHDYNKLLPEVPQDNPKMLGVSGAVELKYSDKFGRHIVATRDINAGETIIVHRSYATLILSKFSHKYCWYCCKRAWSGVPCHRCIEVIYCDETCRDKAWHEHHEIECKVTAATTRNVSLNDLLALRLTVKAYKEAGSLQKLRRMIKKIDAINDPILKCFTDNVFDHTKYASVYSLWRHCKTGYITALKAALILYSLAATTSILGEINLNFKELSYNENAIFIGKLILKNFEIGLMNGAKLSVDDNAGFALDPLWSMFNHSCDPTTINFTSGDITTLTTFQRLKKGEQMFLNYGRPFFNADVQERRVLHRDFQFECECIACEEYWGPDSLLTFPHCQLKPYSPAVLMKKLKLSTTFGKFKSISKMRMANNETKIVLIPDLFRVLDFYHRVYGYPNREMLEIKMVLANMFSSLRYEY